MLGNDIKHFKKNRWLRSKGQIEIKKYYKKKKSLPTDPLFFEPVTGNRSIFFLGLIISSRGLGAELVHLPSLFISRKPSFVPRPQSVVIRLKLNGLKHLKYVKSFSTSSITKTLTILTPVVELATIMITGSNSS